MVDITKNCILPPTPLLQNTLIYLFHLALVTFPNSYKNIFWLCFGSEIYHASQLALRYLLYLIFT